MLNVSGALSVGRQSRPDGERMLVLRADALVAVDPANQFSETLIYTFAQADASRRATFAQVGRYTAVAVTAGVGVGAPDKLLIVQGDEVLETGWPWTPTFSVHWDERTGDEYVPEGLYAFRLAWLLDDGTIGPASGPVLAPTPTAESPDNGFRAVLTIDGYPESVSAAWASRIAGLTVVCHPEVRDTTAVQVAALDVPGYRITGFEGIPAVGDTQSWYDTLEGIVSGELYDTTTLSNHEIQAGAVFGYNRRLVLGDVAYDLERPSLAHHVKGGGGTFRHLLMRVRVETTQGIITRFSEPVGFSDQASRKVELRTGTIFYRDARAVTWDWLVSEDYSGDIAAATWERLTIPGTPRTFKAAGAANLAVAEVESSFIDLTMTETGSDDITSAGWSASFVAEEESQDGNLTVTDTPHSPTLDLDTVLAADQTMQAVSVRLKTRQLTETTGNASANTSGAATVQVLDGGGSILDEQHWTVDPPRGEDIDNFVTILTLDDFVPAEADRIQVSLTADAQTTVSGAGSASAESRMEVVTVTIDTATSSSGDTVPVDPATSHAVLDADPNRIIWSRALRVLDLPAEAVTYAGRSDRDRVLALSAVGQPVSQGQFGQFPIVVFGRESIRLLRVGTNPFVQGVEVLTASTGAVGRRAVANLDGSLAIATPEGIFELTPQLGDLLSAPLHDDAFLDALGPETALTYFGRAGTGRRELWVAAPDVHCLSLTRGAWSTLPIQRRDFMRIGDTVFGCEPTGELVEEAQTDGHYPVTIQTVPTGFDARATLKRLEYLWPVQLGTFTGTLAVNAVEDDASTTLGELTDFTLVLALPTGLGRRYEVTVSAQPNDNDASAGLIGFGVQYDLRDPHRPQPQHT
jgi:hypothetical protein